MGTNQAKQERRLKLVKKLTYLIPIEPPDEGREKFRTELINQILDHLAKNSTLTCDEWVMEMYHGKLRTVTMQPWCTEENIQTFFDVATTHFAMK